jgi:hypothetical protein
MNESYPRVRLAGKRLLVRDLLRIVFFVPYDNFHIASGVSHALDSYLRAVEDRPNALSHYTCCDWEPDRLCDRGWELIRETLNPKEHRFAEDYTPEEAFHFKDGADPYFSIHGETDSGYSFGYHARIPSREPPRNSVSVIRATLPTEYLEERGSGFVRELALDMASRLPFASGHAGLALHYTGSFFDQLDHLRPVMFRHPGFDLRGATIHDDLGTRVDGVHWMNFLGQPVLGELGGATVLRARLLPFPTCTVQEVAGERVLVTLGTCPEAGDLTEGHTLPAYRELARVLEPWQEPFPWGFLGRQNRNTEEELRRWWRRFLD